MDNPETTTTDTETVSTTTTSPPPPPSPPPYVPPPYTPPASLSGTHAADPAMVGDTEIESGPPITHPVWKGLKDWVRNELDLHKAGHSRESREFHNP
jgi:hypothetical protein